MSGHLTTLRNFSRRGTYSPRSACIGCIWATARPAGTPRRIEAALTSETDAVATSSPLPYA
jgi:hypothetical protein